MMGSREKIPDKVLREIFPKKLRRSLGSERIYSQLKQMILSGKIKKGKRLFRETIAQDFSVSETVVATAFSQLKKDGLVIIKGSVGSFVAQRFKEIR
jgi:DNA-binding GntR family transcriptional regulator